MADAKGKVREGLRSLYKSNVLQYEFDDSSRTGKLVATVTVDEAGKKFQGDFKDHLAVAGLAIDQYSLRRSITRNNCKFSLLTESGTLEISHESWTSPDQPDLDVVMTKSQRKGKKGAVAGRSRPGMKRAAKNVEGTVPGAGAAPAKKGRTGSDDEEEEVVDEDEEEEVDDEGRGVIPFSDAQHVNAGKRAHAILFVLVKGDSFNGEKESRLRIYETAGGAIADDVGYDWRAFKSDVLQVAGELAFNHLNAFAYAKADKDVATSIEDGVLITAVQNAKMVLEQEWQRAFSFKGEGKAKLK